MFADLSLGPSDDEEGDDTPDAVREGISSFAPLLQDSESTVRDVAIPLDVPTADTTVSVSKKNGKGKRKGKGRALAKTKTKVGPPVPGKWADKCMYAELLEMTEDFDPLKGDGIPDDLETGWVAVTPVPVGKRCLAITHAASGIAGLGELIFKSLALLSFTTLVSAEHDAPVKDARKAINETIPFVTSSTYRTRLHPG